MVGDLTAAQNGSTVSVAKVKEDQGTVSTGIWYTDVNEVGTWPKAPRRLTRRST